MILTFASSLSFALPFAAVPTPGTPFDMVRGWCSFSACAPIVIQGKAQVALMCKGRVLLALYAVGCLVASAGIESIAERYARSIVSELAVRYRM